MTVTYSCTRAAVALLFAAVIASSGAAEELSLREAVQIALKSNPTIAAARLSAEAATHGARAASALTNPTLNVAPSVVGKAGSDSAILLWQPLEINGSRRVRSQIAAYDAAAVAYDATGVRRDVVLRVKELYWDVARAQEVVELAHDNIAYLEALDNAVRKQLDVGAVPGSRLIKSEVEVAQARQELAQAQLQSDQARSALGTALNRRDGADLAVKDSLVFFDIPMQRETLVAASLDNRPEIALARAQRASASRRIAAARVERLPDIILQARKESFDGGEGGIAVMVVLPVLDWGSIRARKREAESEVRSRQKEIEAVRNTVVLQVEQAVRAVETSSNVIREYQDGIIEKSEELATMARKGYEKGATSYLEVLEAQRTVRNTRRDYISALAGYAKAVAQLEWATGCPVESEVDK